MTNINTQFKKGHVGYKAHLGIPKPEEVKRKISETHKKRGIKPVKPFRWSGKKRAKRSKEWQEKISSSFRGEKNHNWKGGSWGLRKEWVKTRDDYTCQICGLRDLEIMEVDHIKERSNFPELALELNNLLTLCPNCHRRKTNRFLKSRKFNQRNNQLIK